MKIAIIGNGAIASFTAARLLHDYDSIDITLFGPSSRPLSASKAAGLMLNIFSEVDSISCSLPLTTWKLKNASFALQSWSKFFGSDGFIGPSVFTGPCTEVYLPKDSTNTLEIESFATQQSIAQEYAVGSEYSPNRTLLPDEPSADARDVLRLIDEFLDPKVHFVDAKVHSITYNNSKYSVIGNNSSKSEFDKVFLLAGSASSSILNNSQIPAKPEIQCFNGVGSALLVSNELDYINNYSPNHILRSPNRGGTCGLHLVPCVDSFYVGASSVVTDRMIRKPRFGSVQALLNGSSTELKLPDLTRFSFDILTGYRPVTQDAYPIFGEIYDGFFVGYGHKRDGFTWSPYLSSIMSKWLSNKSFTEPEKIYLSMCDPLRQFTTFGEYDLSLSLYLNNERYSALQHGQVLTDMDFTSLSNRFHEVHSFPQFKGHTLHPELVNVNYFHSLS